jgi:hypothetical protein
MIDFKKLMADQMDSAEKQFRENTKPAIQEMIDRGEKISYEKYSTLRLNSYEFVQVYKILDDEALIKVIAHAVDNCSKPYRTIPEGYEHALVYELVPILLGRLKKKKKK